MLLLNWSYLVFVSVVLFSHKLEALPNVLDVFLHRALVCDLSVQSELLFVPGLFLHLVQLLLELFDLFLSLDIHGAIGCLPKLGSLFGTHEELIVGVHAPDSHGHSLSGSC